MRKNNHNTVLFISLLILLVLSANCFAETAGFQISDYIPERFEDLEWRVNGAFRLKGDNNENTSNRNRTYPYNDDYLVNMDRDYDQFIFALGSDLNYDYVTIPHFLIINTSLDANINFSSNHINNSEHYSNFWDQEKSDKSSRIYDFRINNKTEAGHYLNNDFFISAIANFNYTYSEVGKDNREQFVEHKYYYEPYTTVNQSRSDVDQRSDSRNIFIDGELSTGWGRVYEGSYASTALYIIEELKKDGLLVKNPTQRNLLNLTEIIYQYRQKHAIDKRIHKIESLKNIIEFLEKENLIVGTGANDYLLIQDVWDYFPRYNRKFGSKIRLGVGFDYNYNNYHYSSTSDSHSFEYRYNDNNPQLKDTLYIRTWTDYKYASRKFDYSGTYLALNAEYNVPLNHQWQLKFLTSNKYYLKAERDNENYNSFIDTYSSYPWLVTDNIDYNDYYQLQLVSDIDYIINSRTSMNFLGVYSYYNRDLDGISRSVSDFFENSNTQKIKESGWSLSFNVNMKYRISIPTTFNVNLSYVTSHNDNIIYYNDDKNAYDFDNGHYFLTLSLAHYLY